MSYQLPVTSCYPFPSVTEPASAGWCHGAMPDFGRRRTWRPSAPHWAMGHGHGRCALRSPARTLIGTSFFAQANRKMSFHGSLQDLSGMEGDTWWNNVDPFQKVSWHKTRENVLSQTAETSPWSCKLHELPSSIHLKRHGWHLCCDRSIFACSKDSSCAVWYQFSLVIDSAG